MAVPHETYATRFGLRPMAYGRRGVVATANPLATLAGVRMLAEGGNAVDAIVAAAAAIGVVEPYMSGLAGCGTAMLTPPGGRPRALVFLGVAPSGATPDRFGGTPPDHGYLAPAVPGNLAGWTRLLAEYGTLPLARVLEPAIEYAEQGIPVTPFDHMQMQEYPDRLTPEAAAVYLDGGRVPAPGTILRQPDLAATFRAIAAEGAGYLYGGPLGQRIARLMRERGGLITEADLAAYPERVRWLPPISAAYRGVTVYAPPPPTSAVQVLETLRILEGFDLGRLPHLGPEHVGLVAEAVRLARVDTDRHVGDPAHVPPTVEHVLSAAHVGELQAQVRRPPAGAAGGFADGDSGAAYGSTTHLAAVDGNGLAVNITHSLGSGFGSGVVVPGTGVCLNNALHWFSMQPGHPNEIAPGRMHAWPIAPLHLHREGGFWATVGTPGSFGILATTAQVVVNLVDFGLNVQDAVSAPRFRWADDVGAELPATRIMMEARFPEETRRAMAARGYTVEPLGAWSMRVGGCQAIVRDPASGWLAGGADPRRNGYAMGW
jgi:gamma-glutamyltranspeptidase/glutathione hydrolase